jgi:hypothetical protein
MTKFLVVGIYLDDMTRFADTYETDTPEEAERQAPAGVTVAGVINEATLQVVA